MKLQTFNPVAQVYKYDKIKNKYQLIDMSLCPKQNNEKYHDPNCIQRKCNDCGVALLEKNLSRMKENHGDVVVHWLKWEDKEYVHNGVTKTKKGSGE